MQPGCASDEELGLYSRRALTDDDAARITRHIAECSDCRVVLAELARASQPDSKGPPRPLMRGRTFGRYLILEQVGEGGMGIVYRAYDPDLDRRVALKLLRYDGEEKDRARLQREARSMAQLNHPNVATVYSVEQAEDRDFVTMEFIVGVTARRWFEVERPVADVLDVFLQAGRALAAAHDAGIVHRDFKPDNVMVRDDGRVSVLDFGLARPMGAAIAPVRATASSDALTQTGTVMGTLRYMPPEQREARVADARADQYAFCVSLHEALWGATPGEPAKRNPKVSARLLQALEQGRAADPAQRHPDMGALLRELERVRRPRRRLWVPVVTALMVAVLSVFAYSRWNSSLCTGGAEELATVWNAPVKEQLVARLAAAQLPVSDLPRALDAYASEWVEAHREACAATRLRGEQSEDLLDRRMVCLDARRAALGATLTAATASEKSLRQAQLAVGNLPAIIDCADAVNLHEAVPPPRTPEGRAQLVHTREALARARATFDVGRTDDAVPLAKDVVEAAGTLGYAPLTAEALLLRSTVANKAGDTKACEASAWQALRLATQARDGRLIAEAWVNLASVTGNVLRRYPESERHYVIAWELLQQVPNATRLEARWFSAHGQTRELAGETARAIDDHTAAIERLERLDLASPSPLARAYTRLCDSYFAAGRLEEAEAAGWKAVRLSQSDVTGSSHLTRSLSTLADVLRAERKFDEARPLLVQAVGEAVKSGGRMSVTQAWSTLGELERDAGRLDAAIHAFQMMVAETEGWPPPNPYLGEALGLLGAARLERGEVDDALRALRRAVVLFDEFGAHDEPDTLPARVALGRALVMDGQLAEAQPVLTHVVSILDGGQVPGTLASQTGFAAAQALWALPAQRVTARRLAVRAKQGAAPATQAEVEAWLTTHR